MTKTYPLQPRRDWEWLSSLHERRNPELLFECHQNYEIIRLKITQMTAMTMISLFIGGNQTLQVPTHPVPSMDDSNTTTGNVV
jgi:hypothetical protein